MSARSLLLLLLFPASALRVQAEPCAVLWVPTGTVSAVEIGNFLDEHSSLRLTLAVSPESVDKPSELSRWTASKQLELALRLPQDPLLPLAASRMQDVLGRLALAKQRHRDAFGVQASGFVPAQGALPAALSPLLAAQGLRWAAIGAFADGSPFRLHSGGFLLASASSLPNASIRLSTMGPADLGECPATVSELAEKSSPIVDAEPSSLPTWEGPLSDWTRDPDAKNAWSSCEKAAQSLSQYQNSGRASMISLEKAQSLLYAAQEARFYSPRALPSDRKEQASRLHAFYKAIGQEPPMPARISGIPSAQEAQAGAVRISQAEASILFENAASSSPSRAELSSLRVSWDDQAVTFEVGLSSDPALEPLRPEELLFDLYIDVNHRPGSGSAELLPGREPFVASENGWEQAISLVGNSAALFRSAPGQEPIFQTRLKAQTDAQRAEIRITASRARLRGNPAAWGYLPLLMRAAKASSARTPNDPEGLRRPDASRPADALAAASVRKSLQQGARGRRLPMLRLDAEFQ
ncbi:MAG: glucodextranase DOMON-like domain-containing protein [Elusimicrobiota bacterium]|jgi:hypothetical protein